ncbi:phage antirepressor N-terminal domain-containing protein [Vibrio crassostreae]|uniref:Antirepressor protein ant N-terminal domain-containing protein n=1 Tax=Vibrio crassostreae TaxID=246167 RepID=A0ABM9QSG8_9VIBR|nr:phage antirepressor N-terminal domain-containing protein [Vibrio crassostreae]MDH5952025.1 phage antirepressor N-terminal domain-containing protein [Vibrio crassostreae]CAK1816789.1 Antirepressor protein ant N-terminal domain-containing protein [Vibrio crassostreae]CAK2165685.1 Antirepressor protein ant N-terminal domain-containing protein [Vibrio crassostreae]CAK2168597.1 Antirepressor protein ant N-terminal domain-containing protein [Vibrio crassostreae]CAK2172875.1 Antirepressor protein 
MSTLINVPFHGSNLLVVGHNNEPYIPMKPIVEGIGLNWKTQYRKLAGNSDRWSMVMMTTVASDNKNRETTCIPLRKLFGWLQTLQPNRIREEIRDKVIQYQNECDDVLWRYWNNETNQLPTSTPPCVTTKLLMTLENGRVIGTVPVGNDVMVFERSRLPELLREPGYFSIEDYAKIAETANSRLAELLVVKGKSW